MSVQSDRRSTRSWAVPVAVLAVLALLITVVLNLGSGSAGSESGADSTAPGADSAVGEAGSEAAPTEVQGVVQPDLTDIERRDEADPLTAGPVDAPVVLVVFSDYQCPYCARWSEDTLPVMMERAEAGELRIEWRDVNIFGDASERASRAAYAAALQGTYWEFHDALYPEGDTRSEGDLSQEALVALADELGLDIDQFTADMASADTGEQIEANATLGLDLGAYSTPAFILAGQPIVGAQPTEVFVDALDAALAG